MKRRIYAELDVCEETSSISLVNLGCFTSPLLVTEYQMFKPHSSGLYRKAINNSLKQFKPEMHVPSEELFIINLTPSEPASRWEALPFSHEVV